MTVKDWFTGFGGPDMLFTEQDPLVKEKILSVAATSVQFESNVLPNKKYYYTFRVVDMEGNFSNPTPVYQVEIVNDRGTIYTIIDIVDFDWEDSLQTTKSMRKYIHIIPSIEQSMLDYGVAGANYNANKFNDDTAATYLQKSEDKEPKLVINEEYKLFQKSTDQLFAGKKEYFKIRLTSKKTGKKCDINFMFKNKHIVTEEEKQSEVNTSEKSLNMETPS